MNSRASLVGNLHFLPIVGRLIIIVLLLALLDREELLVTKVASSYFDVYSKFRNHYCFLHLGTREPPRWHCNLRYAAV